MSSGSITVNSTNSSNILVSTVNPISGTAVNGWSYLLIPYVEGASSNTYDVTIVNPEGITIYGCILGPGGNGGNYKNWNNGTYSAGGGGGGMGGFINFTFPNSTSSSGDEYTFTINSVGENKSTISSSSVSISAQPGEDGNNGSEDSTGFGGDGADCDSSDASGIESTGTYYGGGGGGSGATESGNGCSVAEGGTGGSGKTLNGEPGVKGSSSGGNGGDGGGVTITFSDGTTYSETGGRGGKPFNNGISGPLSWAMIYYPSNSQTVTINSSSQAITPSITVTVTKNVVNNGVTTTTQTTNGISVSTVNPLTYYSGGFTYILVECLKCSYNNDDDQTYYTCSWTVPTTGKYYFATVGPGGPAGIYSKHHESNPNYTVMSGGGGNGAFINGTLIPGYSYSYTMWNLSLNPSQSTDQNNTTATKSETYNELVATVSGASYTYQLQGADLPGAGSAGAYTGGNGSNGCSYNQDSVITSMLNKFTCNGGGGGGGGAAVDDVNNQHQTAYGGNGGHKGEGGSGGLNGTPGVDGAETESSSWPPNKDSEPGQSTYTLSDGSSTLISAGSGGYGNGVSSGGNNADLIQATCGVSTWMMIYYQTQTST